jgi:hypothetical protein
LRGGGRHTSRNLPCLDTDDTSDDRQRVAGLLLSEADQLALLDDGQGLVARNVDGEILSVWAGIVGRDGIEADQYYELVSGKPEKAD